MIIVYKIFCQNPLTGDFLLSHGYHLPGVDGMKSYGCLIGKTESDRWVFCFSIKRMKIIFVVRILSGRLWNLWELFSHSLSYILHPVRIRRQDDLDMIPATKWSTRFRIHQLNTRNLPWFILQWWMRFKHTHFPSLYLCTHHERILREPFRLELITLLNTRSSVRNMVYRESRQIYTDRWEILEELR